MNDEQVAIWVNAFSICSHLSMAIDEMYCADPEEKRKQLAVRHKEESEKRRNLDAEDGKVYDELKKHSHPLETDNNRFSAFAQYHKWWPNQVSVYTTIEEKMKKDFSVALPGGFHKKTEKKVKTMQQMKKAISVKRKPVYDMESIFTRLLVVGQQRATEMKEIFKYEFSGIPPALVDEFGCLRKGDESVLVKRLGCPCENVPASNVLVDASQLLFYVVWQLSGGTVSGIADTMMVLLKSDMYRTAEKFVNFDR